MKIGILSDTHGDVVRTARAVRLLLAEHVAAICHCGDIGDEAVLVELASACRPAGVPVYAVLGNVDHWDSGVRCFPAGAGVDLRGRTAELELGGIPVAVVHGDDPGLLEACIRNGRFRYVFTGHTHVADAIDVGSTRVINPGAVYRSPHPSVAVLDLERDDLRWLPLRGATGARGVPG